MKIQTIAILAAAAFTLDLAGSAGAASFVDVTYELSGTTFNNPDFTEECPGSTSNCLGTDLLASSITVRYTSNSQSSMPILHGPATLLSMTLNAQLSLVNTYNGNLYPFTSANANINLLSPVVGSLLSNGTLAFAGVQIGVTGSRHCTGFPVLYTGLCVALAGTITSVTGPLGPSTYQATFALAASAGPYGGALSTRHTVSGTMSLLVEGKALVPFATSVNILGREILRQAEGHDPKVIPEPGTLLLLGAGAAGLALVGRATRQSRRG